MELNNRSHSTYLFCLRDSLSVCDTASSSVPRASHSLLKKVSVSLASDMSYAFVADIIMRNWGSAILRW